MGAVTEAVSGKAGVPLGLTGRRAASVILVFAVIVAVAASAVIAQEASTSWWGIVLGPVGSACVLILGAKLRRPDAPLSDAVTFLIDLPLRQPRVGSAVAIAAVTGAALLVAIAHRMVQAEDGHYWIIVTADGTGVAGLTVVLDRQAGPHAPPERRTAVTGTNGAAAFPVSLGDAIWVRLERGPDDRREFYSLKPGAFVDAALVDRPDVVHLDQLPAQGWKPVRHADPPAQPDGSGGTAEDERDVVALVRAEPYLYRWTEGLPRQTPVGDAALEPAIAPYGLPPAEIVVRREAYVLGFSPYWRLPRWVASRVLTGEPIRRTLDDWRPDPAIPSGVQAAAADFRGPAFDRGHLVRRSDVALDEDLAQSINLYSMATPQTVAFNRQAWLRVEDFATRRGRSPGTTVHLLRGPVFMPAADGFVALRLIGPGRLPVPTHFFQVTLVRGPDREELHCFLVPNDPVADVSLRRIGEDALDAYRISLEELRTLTGLDLLPALPPTVAGC